MAREQAPPDPRLSVVSAGPGRRRSRRQILRLAALGVGAGVFSSLLAACESPLAGQPSIIDRLPTASPAATASTVVAAPVAAPTATRPVELPRPATPTERPRPLPTATRGATSTPIGEIRPIAPGTGITPRRAIPAGSRIPWQGQSWYLHGANVPWLNWARDFGGGTRDGVSKPDNRKSLSDGFAAAKSTGVNIVRWWVFEGDAWQIKRDSAGLPTGLDEAIYADFDAALELADEHDLYYVFVLFSAPQHIPRSWMDDNSQRAKLAQVLGPLFARYKENPRVMTWEVFNEPEFDVWDQRVRQEPMLATIKEIADSVHANSNAYVTVGSAMLEGLAMMKGLGLDYYQAHWYDYMSTGKWCALCTTYDEVRRRYDLDAPLVIGEIYLSPELENPHLRLEDFYTKGYAGVWPWSIFPDVTQDKYAIDWAAMKTFAGRHSDLGPRTTEAVPATEGTPTLRLSLRSTAQVGARRVIAGQRQPIEVKVTATIAARAQVEMGVYDPGGQRAFQQMFEDQSFRPGETKVYSTVWPVPLDAAAGTYVVKTGVFAPDRGTRYDANESAATFTVVR